MNNPSKIESNAAYIIKRIGDIWGEKPGKKTLQKIIFLLEQKGIDLGYEYGIHFYGPYSAGLDTDTLLLSTDGIIEFEYSGFSHLMGINERDFFIGPNELSPQQIEAVDELINHFQGKTPSELELLTTAIYVYNHLDKKSKESIVNGVQKIKGSKYSGEQINNSLHDFSYFRMPVAQ